MIRKQHKQKTTMNVTSSHTTRGRATHPSRLSNFIPCVGASRLTGADLDQNGLPAPGEHVVVRCHGFQCLAYRDAEGRWRDVRNKNRLPEVLEVVMRF